MFSSQLGKILRQYRRVALTATRQYHGSLGVLSTTGTPTATSLPFHSLNKIALNPGNPFHICCYHSTAPLEWQQENPHEKQIIHLIKQNPVNFQEIEIQLGFLARETQTVLSIHTFIGLVKACIQLKSHPAAEAAERFVFDWMMNFHRQGRLDKTPMGNIFGMAIQAWVNSRHPSSGKRAELLLGAMEEMAREGTLPFPIAAPIYNTVVKAYAIHGDVKNAQAVFDRCMHEFKQGNESARPNVFLWSTLLDAWSRSGNPDAWKEAENLFDAMQKSHKEGILKDPPNTITYNCSNMGMPVMYSLLWLIVELTCHNIKIATTESTE